MSRFRVSMDLGGTFTDVVAYDETAGTYTAGKSSTTSADLTEGVRNALATIDAHPELCSFAVHGTTKGLNAFLQRRGERALLLVTAGAGDVYHIARGNRTRLYDIHFRKPTPLVPRSDIVEVGGRLNSADDKLEPLDRGGVREAARWARVEGFGPVAVAFLFSYLNPGGIGGERARVKHALEIRYVGQEYTLTIPLESASEPMREDFAEAFAARFDAAHETRFCHANPGAPIESVAIRSTALGDLGRAAPQRPERWPGMEWPFEERAMVFARSQHPAPLVRREDLAPGAVVDGPALIVEATATTVVPLGSTLRVDDFGTLLIEIGAEP